MKKNIIPKNFFDVYKFSKKDFQYVKLEKGYLRLEYYEGVITRASFVMLKKDDAQAIGNELFFQISGELNSEEDSITYKTDYSISGIQWSNGEACFGIHTDDDLGDIKGRKISLIDFVDECLGSIINPSKEEWENYNKHIEEEKARYNTYKIIEAIKKAEKTNNPVWELPDKSFSDRKIVDALLTGIKSNSWRVRFSCAQALGYSNTDHPRVVKELISLIKKDNNKSVIEYAIRALGELGKSASSAVSLIVSKLEKGIPDHQCVEALTNIPCEPKLVLDFYKKLINKFAKSKDKTSTVDVPANAQHAIKGLVKLKKSGYTEIDLPELLSPLSKCKYDEHFGLTIDILIKALCALIECTSFDDAINFIAPYAREVKKAIPEQWEFICKESLLRPFKNKIDKAFEALKIKIK